MDTSKITTEAAKSILRVMLAKGLARSVVGTIETMNEIDEPLTEIQKVAVISSTMMDYRSTCDEAEETVDAEVVIDELRIRTARGEVKWATEDELRESWDARAEGM